MPPSLFTPVVDSDKLNAGFEAVRSAHVGHPGRAMMEEIYASFEDPDGNFLEQFQSTGFDARCFELYLFAYLSRARYEIERDHSNPDFIVVRDGCRVALEATTVNPATSGALSKAGTKICDLSGDALLAYQKHELSIRFGSPLFSKLNRRYWELDHCRGFPLVFAIQAFHDEEALSFSDSALSRYLYGLEQMGTWSEGGDLVISTDPIEEHSVEGKTIPSNFFAQPDTEYVSAVVFSNSGSIAKFSRMGFQHGYGNDAFSLTRFGFSFNPDPKAMDPTLFAYDVGQPPLVESWGQGLVVCHNPRARHPLPRDYFCNAVQAHIEDGVFVSEHRGWHPMSSKTLVFHSGEMKKKIPEPLVSRPAVAVGAIPKSEFQEITGIVHDQNPLWDEHGWFGDESNSFLGVVIYDKGDDDWGYVVLARDPYFAFRAIETKASLPSRMEAREALQIRIIDLVRQPKRIFVQD